MHIGHEFPDIEEAEEDDMELPGLFPIDYFCTLSVEDLGIQIRKNISDECLKAVPTIVTLMQQYVGQWVNDFKGLNIEPLPMMWADDTPTVLRTYTGRYSPALTKVAETEFNHLMNIGFIDWSKSNFRSPLTVAPKKTAPFVRLCGNYQKANAFLRNRNLKIPIVRDEINKCKLFSIYSELDWKNAYHQIKIVPEDSARLALQTIWGTVEPKFLWEGIKSASDLMEHCKCIMFDFEDFNEWTIALFDNLLILAHSHEDLLIKMKRILDRAKSFNLVFNIEKSKIGVREIEFFGYLISNGTITMCEARRAPILSMQPPHLSLK